ncbi:MAG: [Fe-Fe] hydrogenase large subunit C-terminal domain-containing protein [Oscillospiraceae bacterium]|nr:[Fe-Fe] hydrogenase large subunit C-terminal domain-containing protein [Oscillospiraceae bacterium]
MMTSDIITTYPERCTGCSKCVRACPVSTANIIIPDDSYSSYKITIDPKKCIGCGECVKVCSNGARDYHDDSDFINGLIENRTPASVIVSTSVRTAFSDTDWKKVLTWLRKNSEFKIYDASFGADICTWVHSRLMKNKKINRFISSSCPAVVSYIEKYTPELLAFLSPVYSPESCMAVYLKKYLSAKTPVILISSCMSKISEAAKYQTFDYAATFERLISHIDKKQLAEINQSDEFEFDYQSGSLGLLSCRPGVIKDSLNSLGSILSVRVSSGPENIYRRLNEYMQSKSENRPDGLEIYHCNTGCAIGSAGSDYPAEDLYMRLEKIEEEAQKSRGTLINKDKLFKDFDKKLDSNDFVCEHTDVHVTFDSIGTDEQDAVYEQMLKNDAASRTVDCGACGYRSCRVMCNEIYYGRNVKENCIEYLKKRMKDNCEKTEIIKATMQQQLHTVEKSAEEIRRISDKIKRPAHIPSQAADAKAQESRNIISDEDLKALGQQADELKKTSESIRNKFS